MMRKEKAQKIIESAITTKEKFKKSVSGKDLFLRHATKSEVAISNQDETTEALMLVTLGITNTDENVILYVKKNVWDEVEGKWQTS